MIEKTIKIISLIKEAKHLILDLEKELKEELSNISTVEDEKLSMSICDLNLSRRAENCLIENNIRTIGELIGYTRSDLIRFRNLGNNSIQDITEKLSTMGLSLGDGKAIRRRNINEILSYIDSKP